jgi:hypothetical protein
MLNFSVFPVFEKRKIFILLIEKFPNINWPGPPVLHTSSLAMHRRMAQLTQLYILLDCCIRGSCSRGQLRTAENDWQVKSKNQIAIESASWLAQGYISAQNGCFTASWAIRYFLSDFLLRVQSEIVVGHNMNIICCCLALKMKHGFPRCPVGKGSCSFNLRWNFPLDSTISLSTTLFSLRCLSCCPLACVYPAQTSIRVAAIVHHHFNTSSTHLRSIESRNKPID